MSDILELFEIGGFEDKLEVTARDGHFNFTVDEPWAGDTETGFGQQTSVALDAEQVRELITWLSARLPIDT